MNKKESILIIDDDETLLKSFKLLLNEKDFEVFTAKNSKQAFKILEKEEICVCLVDYRLLNENGLEVSKKILEINDKIKIIMLTGYPSYEKAVESIKLGIFDYIAKTETNEKILLTIKKAIKMRKKEIKNSEIENKKKPINISLLCSHTFLKKTITDLYHEKYKFNLVENIKSSKELKSRKKILKTDIVLICATCNFKDFNDSIHVISNIKLNYSEAKLVIINNFFNDEEQAKLLSAGIKGFFSKEADLQEFTNGIIGVYNNDLWISRRVINLYFEDTGIYNTKILTKVPKANTYNLTKREFEILKYLISGFKNKEIAERLFISEKTVKTHINKIFKKMNVSNRTSAVTKAIKDKIV